MANCCCRQNRCCCNQNSVNTIYVDYVEGFPTMKVHDLNPCIDNNPCPFPPYPPHPPQRRVSVTLGKVDADTGAPVYGAMFQAVATHPADIQTAVSGLSGQLDFDLYPNVTYTLSEVSAPDGYEPNDTTYTIKVDADGDLYVNGVYTPQLDIANTPQSRVPAATIAPVMAGDTFVSGTGDAGNTVMITWPAGSTPLTSSALVDAQGAWTVAVPGNTTLVPGQTITAVQYAGAYTSRPTTAVVG